MTYMEQTCVYKDECHGIPELVDQVRVKYHGEDVINMIPGQGNKGVNGCA